MITIPTIATPDPTRIPNVAAVGLGRCVGTFQPHNLDQNCEIVITHKIAA